MRRVTEEVALCPDGWSKERASKVTELFDGLAADWHTRDLPGRHAPLDDAIARGGPLRSPLLELGSGTGMATPRLAAVTSPVICADLSMSMLRLAPPIAPRVRADASRLPFADGTFATLVLINMFLFPAEADRVLADDGTLVWVNSVGVATPIHLSAEQVDEALPGTWEGVAGEAGYGTWCSLRRAR
jgi:SAM-dependent methyltransferase